MSKTAVVVVGFNVAPTIQALFHKIPVRLDVIAVDDGSTDGGFQNSPDRVLVLRHATNRGYGAAQKTGYAEALSRGADRIVLVHGDDQYALEDCLALSGALDDADVALGSRFLMPDKGQIIPWWRRFSNRGLTGLANQKLGLSLTDMHTGARAFRATALQKVQFERFSDNYVFDQQMLVAAAKTGLVFAERPQRTRYDDQIQSISVCASIRYGLGCVRTILAS